jgi:hypothetical protein
MDTENPTPETQELESIDCEVICDLLIVYASGEASEATEALIEAHLEICPECQDALEEINMAEAALSDLEPIVKRPQIDGRKVLIFFQRTLFIVLVLVLFLLAGSLSLFENWILSGLLSIPVLSLYVPGSVLLWSIAGGAALGIYALLSVWRTRGEQEDRKQDPLLSLLSAGLIFIAGLAGFKFILAFDFPGVILGGAALFLLYLFTLWRRSNEPRGEGRSELFLSFEAAVPLLVLALAAFTLASTGSLLVIILAAGWLILALLVTFVRLPRLPYMTWMTVLSLLVANLILVGNLLGGVIGLFDLAPEYPSNLGRPSSSIPPAEAASIDLRAYGFATGDGQAITEVRGISIPGDAAAVRQLYERSGGQPAWITVIRFGNRGNADDFFRDWTRAVKNDFYSVSLDLSSASFDDPDGRANHPLSWTLELPGVWFGQEGQIYRGYDERHLLAYSAWQLEDSVTIIEVEGGVAQALPLARDIKRIMADSYTR